MLEELQKILDVLVSERQSGYDCVGAGYLAYILQMPLPDVEAAFRRLNELNLIEIQPTGGSLYGRVNNDTYILLKRLS